MVNEILQNKRLLVLYLFTFESIYVIMGMVECLGCPVIICHHSFGVMLNLLLGRWVGDCTLHHLCIFSVLFWLWYCAKEELWNLRQVPTKKELNWENHRMKVEVPKKDEEEKSCWVWCWTLNLLLIPMLVLKKSKKRKKEKRSYLSFLFILLCKKSR